MDFQNKRLSKEIEILLNRSDAITSITLSHDLKVSVRTIKKDIVEINLVLAPYGMHIESKAGVGYSLLHENEMLYNQFKMEFENKKTHNQNEIPKYRYERVNYIIKKLLTVDYYITLDDLMDELYVSRSTITADMKEVREIFKDYDISIETRPNYGIILKGDEVSKRLCIAEYFFHTQLSTGYLAADNAMFVSASNKEEMQFIRELLLRINESENIRMSDQSFQNFVIHILIAIRRWKFYGYVKQDNEKISGIKKTDKEYIAAKKLISEIEKHLNIVLPETEIVYFALHFKSKHITELNEIERKDIELVEKTFYSIYHYLQHNYSYIVKSKEFFEENMRLHIPAMVSRLRTGMVMRNPQTFEILTKYLCSVHLTVTFSRMIEENFQVKMNSNEFCYLALYTNLLFNFRANIDEKILLVCGRGRPETITLLNALNEETRLISNRIEVCDVSDLENKDESKYDLIACTVPLEKEFKTPCYFMSGDYSYVDELNRISRMNRLSYKKLGKYFSKCYFNSEIKGTARDEVFHEVAENLNNKQLTDEFWEAEHIISHETTNNTVFLHTLDPIEGNFVYIGILKKPIIWKKQWAQIVIFVNVKDDLRELFNVYQYLSEIVMSSISRVNLSDINTFSDFEREILTNQEVL